MTVKIKKTIHVELPISWEAPPITEAKRGRRDGTSNIPWGEMFNLMMSHPNQWAKTEVARGSQLKTRMVKGNLYKNYPQLQLPHHWEFLVYDDILYFRYLGEELPQ